MKRFITAILSIVLWIGATDAIVSMTLKMAGLASYAHRHDQISYAEFTRSMTSAKRLHANDNRSNSHGNNSKALDLRTKPKSTDPSNESRAQ